MTDYEKWSYSYLYNVVEYRIRHIITDRLIHDLQKDYLE